MLINRLAHAPPRNGHLHLGVIHEPAIADTVATRTRRIDHQRREALHPPIDRHLINIDATLSEQYFDIAARQAVTQIPAHRQRDHVGRDPNPANNGKWDGNNEPPKHATPAPDPPTQLCQPRSPPDIYTYVLGRVRENVITDKPAMTTDEIGAADPANITRCRG
jgi:hypothetical protein